MAKSTTRKLVRRGMIFFWGDTMGHNPFSVCLGLMSTFMY